MNIDKRPDLYQSLGRQSLGFDSELRDGVSSAKVDEGSMILKLIKGLPVWYDADRKVVCTWAHVAGQCVKCAVSAEALQRIAKDNVFSAAELIQTFEDHREHVEQVANYAFQHGLAESDGSIIILPDLFEC